MVEKSDIRKIILEICGNSRDLQYNGLKSGVPQKIAEYNLGTIDKDFEKILSETIWDLISERILTLGTESGSEPIWPFLRLTAFGKSYVGSEVPLIYDEHEYIKYLQGSIPNVENTIVQYLSEALKCYSRRLYFASAVRIGASAERSVLLLLNSILEWEENQNNIKNIKSLLERPNLPKIFKIINSTIDHLIEKKMIPYSIHEGCTQHLLSFFEMIRVQRNHSVHPIFAEVDRNKILISLNTFPAGLSVIYNLSDWFLAKGRN